MAFEKITESESLHQNLDNQSVEQLLSIINAEDQKVALAITFVLPSIKKLTDQIIKQLKIGGRLFYIGAGTSGRLGILDASRKSLRNSVLFLKMKSSKKLDKILNTTLKYSKNTKFE